MKIKTTVSINSLLKKYNWDIHIISELPFINDDNWVVTEVHNYTIFANNTSNKQNFTIFKDYTTLAGKWHKCYQCSQWFKLDDNDCCPYCDGKITYLCD